MTSLRVIVRSTVVVGLLLVAQFAVALPARAGFEYRAGPFIIENVASGDCLDQDYTNGVEHSTVLAFTCTNGANQIWWFDVYTGGEVHIVNWLSGKCLDQDYTNDVEHPNVIAWDCNFLKENQAWGKLGDTTFRLQNYMSLKYLDQDYTNGVPHQAVLAFPFKEVRNQLWKYRQTVV